MFALEPKVPYIDMKVRWNSTFQMLSFALTYKKALNHMATELKLTISVDDWERVDACKQILEPYKYLTDILCKEKYVSISKVVLGFNYLMDELDKLLVKYKVYKNEINKGYEKLKHYYKKTDESGIFLTAAVLDPNTKLAYFVAQEWSKDEIKLLRDMSGELFEHYKKEDEEKISSQNFFDLFWKKSEKKDELTTYLNSEVEQCADSLKYWCNKKGSEGLKTMARDVLSIPATTCYLERSFCRGVDLVTPARSRLTKNTIQACMCVSHWLKNKD